MYMFWFPNINSTRTTSSLRCQRFSCNGEFPCCLLHTPPPLLCRSTRTTLLLKVSTLGEKNTFEMNIVSPCRLVSFPARCPEPDRALKGAEQTELRQLYAETQALSLVSLRSFYCYTLPFFFLPESSHNTLISRENTRLPHKRVNPQRGKYKQASSCTQIGAQVKHTGFLRVHQAPFIARYCVPLWSLEVSFLPCCPPAF